MEVEKETTPHSPARLWHQEGAQQPWKAKPRRRLDGDAALATDHAAPPFLGKRSRANVFFPLRTVTPTSSHRRPPYGELLFNPSAELL